MATTDLLGSVRCVGCKRFGAPLCGECTAGLRRAADPPELPNVDRTIAAFSYEGHARSLILGLKLRHLRPLARPLVGGMVEAVWRHGLLGDEVTWVPGRPWDIIDRGFDHARVLGVGVARATGLRAASLLARRGAAPDQASLSRDLRWSSVEGGFVAGDCRGARMVLVDDLVTTGATASACARALKEKGATSVEVITACLA